MTRAHQNLMVAAFLAFCGTSLAAIESPKDETPKAETPKAEAPKATDASKPAETAKTPDLAGTWSWRWKGPDGEQHKHVLEVEGTGKSTAARERFDEMEPVKVTDLKIVGKTVSFSVMRGERRATYSGNVGDDDTINGTVTVVVGAGQAEKFGWTAKREPNPKPKATAKATTSTK